MLLRFGDSLRSSPLICNHEHLRGSPPDFDLPLSVPDNLSLTCKLLWEQKRNWCDHHCQQCWHLYAGCCCIWQQSHNYRKNDTPLILGDQHCCFFLNCMLSISWRCYIHPTWVFVSLVGKFLSALCCSCDITHPSTFWHDILVEKQPFQFWSFLMRNISHIHEWEILHG